MKKEEILEKSRQENKKRDEYEIRVDNKATTYAALAMLILTSVFFIYEIVTGQGQNYSLYSILAIFNTFLYGYRGIKLEKNRKLNIFTSVIWGLLTIGLVLQYFKVI